MPAFEFDVIVAGGGPAGSSTASYLRMRNRRVLVLEREEFPRFHLGESLLAFSQEIFRELGVFDELERRYIQKWGARIIHEESGAQFTYYFDTAIRPGCPYAWQVPRADFDKLLLDNARRLGAEVREKTEVRDVKFHPDRVIVTARDDSGREYQVEAPMFIDATGRDTFLATEYKLKAPDELITTNVACFTHYKNALREPGLDEGNFQLILFDGGWWWYIPFKGDITSIGVCLEKSYTMERKGLTPEQLFDGAVAEQTYIKKILAGAERVRPVGTTGNWSYRSRQFYGDRFLLVGDAAAFIDPLFSTGVLMALTSGKYAAEAIDEALTDGNFQAERFAPYEEKALGGADIFKKLVHEFYAENLRQLLIVSSTNPTICAVMTSLLAGDVYKKAIWHGLVREGFSRMVDSVDERTRARTSRQTRDGEGGKLDG